MIYSLNDLVIPKVQQHLGLCQRASKLLSGDILFDALSSKTVKLVLLADDASDRTRQQYLKKCDHYDIPVLTGLSSTDISSAIGKTNRMALGVIDDGFARLILKTTEKG